MKQKALQEAIATVEQTLDVLGGGHPRVDFITESDYENWEKDQNLKREIIFRKLRFVREVLVADLTCCE